MPITSRAVATADLVDRNGNREDFVTAWWIAWAKADNKIDRHIGRWGTDHLRLKPKGVIFRNSHGDVWLLVEIPYIVPGTGMQ